MTRSIESPAEGILRYKRSTILRSSSLFFVRQGKDFDTLIVFLNHFLVKRDIRSVNATICLRDIDGKVVEQHAIVITEPRVYEIAVRDLVDGAFVGSAEVIFESEENLGVPFSAVTVVYRSRDGICQLHSYTRRYNSDEIGTPAAIDLGVETGWLLRDDDRTESFFVLHGSEAPADDKVRVTVWNAEGDRRELSASVGRAPFDTRVLGLQRDFDFDVRTFLAGREGYATIGFTSGSVFPRLLCGNQRVDESGATTDLQVTHTNFDFSKIDQLRLRPEAEAWAPVPGHRDGGRSALLVYPGSLDDPPVVADCNGGRAPIQAGSKLHFEGRHNDVVGFHADGGGLPCRIVLGLQVEAQKGVLPCECSYGALTTELAAVPKRFFWGFAMGDGEEAWFSGFSRPLPGVAAAESQTVRLSLYDTEGVCGSGSIAWSELAAAPIPLSSYLHRRPKGSVFYTCFVEGVIAWFMCDVFDPRRGSGSIEHSY